METGDKKHQEFAKEYLSSLVDLTYNSKPLIDMLTILAEENIEHGQVIVDAVEQHISKVATEYKLPVLYLIDSVVKNVGGEYTTLFSHSIVNIFCGVFEKVNEKVRQKMFSLRQTWNDVFTQPKLYALDLKVNTMDRAWPITAKVAPAIHVNPNFLKTQPEKDLQSQLLDKQLELLELQNRKLELEMAKKRAVEKEMKQRQLHQVNDEPRFSPPTHQIVTRPIPVQQIQGKPHVLPPAVSMPPAAPNRVRVAPVTPSMLSRVRDPRLARLQQQQQQHQQQQCIQQANSNHQLQLVHNVNHQHNNMLPPSTPVALAAIPSYTATKTLNGSSGHSSNLFGMSAAAAVTNADLQSGTAGEPPTPSNIQDQILADLEVQMGKAPREVKQRIAHKSPPAKAQSASNSSQRTKSSDGSGRPLSKTAASSRSSGSTSKAAKSSSSSRDRSDRGSRSSADYKSGVSSRRSNSDDRKKLRTTSNSSSTSPNKKSPKRSGEEQQLNKLPNSLGKDGSRTATASGSSAAASGANVATTSSSSNRSNKGGSLAEKYRSYLERHRDKSGSPTANNSTADGEQSSGAIMLSETKPFSENNALLLESINTEGIDARMVMEIAAKMKRMPEERTELEPLNKKTKSEKIDILFGSEDVDLRQLMNPAIMGPMSAPPSGISTASDSDTSVIQDSSPTKLDVVRAKLAAASRPLENRVAIQLDMDMRQQTMNATISTDHHSDATNETKFNDMVAQAQAQLDQNLITLDQFNQTISQLRVQHKSITSLKRKIDANPKRSSAASGGGGQSSATSDDEAEEVSSASDDTVTISDVNRSVAARHKRDRRTSDGSDSAGGSGKSTQRIQRTRKSKWSAPVAIDAPQPSATNVTMQSVVGLPIQQTHAVLPPAFELPLEQHLPPSVVQQPPPVSVAPLSGLWPTLVAQQQQVPPPSVVLPMMWQQPPPTMLPPPSMLGMPAFGHPSQHIDPNAVVGPVSEAKLSHSITIDGISREIRYYGETAIAFMDNEPRELGFNAGERVVRVDQKDAIRLVFNDAYAPFTIDGCTYQIRFGTPMRELYINQQWFECLFGEPSYIQLADGRRHMFEVEGPSPQVRIGALRRDLCAGRIDLYIDSTHKTTFFLDALPQPFELDGTVHTLQFFDYFMTVLIDGQTFGMVQYGGMPKRFRIGARERFIRFAVLPDGLQAGKVFVKKMLRTDRHRNMASPLPAAVAPVDMQPPSSLQSGSTAASTGGASSVGVAVPALNINDLLQKLVASGMLDTGNSKSNDDMAKDKAVPAEAARGTPIDFSRAETVKQRQSAHVDTLFAGMQCSSCGVRFPSEQTVKYSQHLDWHFRQNRRDRDLARRAHSRRWYYDVGDWVQYEEIEDADEREKSWFEQQQADLGADLGMTTGGAGGDDSSSGRETVPSCVAGIDDVDKTCDMCHDRFETFYNEESEDWHLRDAVREDCGTFHPICLKDYKASLTLDESTLRTSEMDDAEGDNAVDLPVKRETDDINIVLDDDDDDVIVLPTEEPTVTEIQDEDAVAHTAPTTPPPSSSDDAKLLGEAAASSTPAVGKLPVQIMNYEPVGNESDLQILVPQISVLDLDEFEERSVEERAAAAEVAAQQLQVKIKEEPRNQGYRDELEAEEEDDGFEEVGTIESAAIDDDSADILLQEIVDSSTSNPPTSNSPTPLTSVNAIAPAAPLQAELTGLDGNIQPVVAAAPPSATNKIKINITKNVSNQIVINSSENTEKPLHLNNSELNSTETSVVNTASSTTTSTSHNSANINNNHNTNNYGTFAVAADGGNGPSDVDHSLPISGHYDVTGDDTSQGAGFEDGLQRSETPSHQTPYAEPEPDIEFEYKQTMRGVRFQPMQTVRHGVDASGLCSIM